MTAALPTDADRDAIRSHLRTGTILIVDDEEANLDLLEAVLEEAGFTSLVRVSDARRVLETAARARPDLVLLDLHMPHRHGLEVLRDLRDATPPDEYLPILVLTADVTATAKERALREGARDFLTKPFDTVEVILRVENLLETRFLHAEQRSARQRAEESERRAALLAEWSRRLALSLDATTALSQLPSLVVPDWCEACIVIGGAPDAPILADQYDVGAENIRTLLLDARRTTDTQERTVRLQLPGPVHGIAALVALGANPGGGFVGSLLFARSDRPFSDGDESLITELARRAGLAAERARLFAAAELATRERERLLAVVAHDLRNPLGVVAMYSEMMASLQPDSASSSNGTSARSAASEEYFRAALDTIHRTTKGMQTLVEDLLDATTLREGAFKLNVTEHDAGALISQMKSMLHPLASSRQMKLVVETDLGSPPRRVRADAGRLGQVLSNLVGNALKFSHPDGTIVVRCQADDDGLIVEVHDDGDGIAPEELPHLFTAFWQGKAHNMRGAGLGLWIARAIVEGHGGEITVDSSPGAGATFRFILPNDGRARRWED